MKLLHPNEANGWAKSSFWHEINEVKLYKALSICHKWMQNPLYQDVMYRLVVDNQRLGLLTLKTHFLVLFFFKKNIWCVVLGTLMPPSCWLVVMGTLMPPSHVAFVRALALEIAALKWENMPSFFFVSSLFSFFKEELHKLPLWPN